MIWFVWVAFAFMACAVLFALYQMSEIVLGNRTVRRRKVHGVRWVWDDVANRGSDMYFGRAQLKESDPICDGSGQEKFWFKNGRLGLFERELAAYEFVFKGHPCDKELEFQLQRKPEVGIISLDIRSKQNLERENTQLLIARDKALIEPDERFKDIMQSNRPVIKKLPEANEA